ncbi:MAG TPA: anti-sigma factor [Candidatus Acidoferrum sp.]|nr:anti-sigma factor [Candidatus Acidoferrum sp.]
MKATHDEFLELCAAATAGELTPAEQAKLDAHLAACADCRRAMREYEVASQHGAAALASELAREGQEVDDSWSVEEAEKTFFRNLETKETCPSGVENNRDVTKQGQRFTYRPTQIRWREVWMPFAAAVLLALALGIAAYRGGVKRGTDAARTIPAPAKDSQASLEEQMSDAGHERAQLLAKLAEEDRVIADLQRKLSEQQKMVSTLKATESAAHVSSGPPPTVGSSEAAVRRDQELVAAQSKLGELQKTIDTVTEQRDEVTLRAATLEAKVGDLTQQVRDREQELDQKQDEVAKQQDLLEHDRDIRELMGARDLYIAEVHDVAGTGQTDKTYGRVFYTRGKRLIFYAYDLDAHPGVRNASTFQAWGRRGPDKQQARNLGIFYEDNVNKKRWVLKANDPKSLEDIDAVFVTVEPNGGSPHPSGKQLLFAYLRISPNHP